MPGAFDHAAFDADVFDVEFWDDATETKETWVKIPPPERREIKQETA